jgi:hypothetical protein
MTTLQILVFTVNTPEGVKKFVSYLPHEFVMKHGLMGEGVLGQLRRPLEGSEPISPEVFIQNRSFVDFMHGVIQRRAPETAGLAAEAQRQGEGWVYIVDQRTPNPSGDVPPQDVVGAFEVKGGSVEPNSYQANKRHRVMTADGFVDLGVEIRDFLIEEVKATVAE